MDASNIILSPLNVTIPISLIETEKIIVNIEYYQDFESTNSSLQKRIVLIYYFYIKKFWFVFFIFNSLKELSVELNSDCEYEKKDDNVLKVPIPESLIEIKA